MGRKNIAKPKDLKRQVGHSFGSAEVPHIDRDASPEAGDFGSRFSILGGVTRPLLRLKIPGVGNAMLCRGVASYCNLASRVGDAQ